MSRRRSLGLSPSVNIGGAQARQLSAGREPLPPPVSTRAPVSAPMPQQTGSAHEPKNPIRPGRSLHRAGNLHGGRGKMPKYSD